MGYIDYMCYKVAQEIIEDIFLVKYRPTITDDKTWYENLNDFLVKEYLHLQKNDVDTDNLITLQNNHTILKDKADCDICYKYVDYSDGYYVLTRDDKMEKICDNCWMEQRKISIKYGYKTTRYNENGEFFAINDDSVSEYESSDYSNSDSDADDEKDNKDNIFMFGNIEDEKEELEEPLADDKEEPSADDKEEPEEPSVDEKEEPSADNKDDKDDNNQFSDEEQHLILSNAMDILLDKLEIDGDEFEDFEGEVDWSRFDDIIGYYMDTIIKQNQQSTEINTNDNVVEPHGNLCIICKIYYNYDTTTNEGNTIDNYCYECYCKKDI